jgi:hypothetical protein
MPVRPYLLVGAGVLAAVQRALDLAVDAWCADWDVAREGINAQCVRACEDDESSIPWRQTQCSGAATLYLGWPDDAVGQVQRQLFAPDRTYPHGVMPPAPMASAMADSALCALFDAVTRSLLPGATTGEEIFAPAALAHPASGAIMASIRLGRLTCRCLLDADATRIVAEQARLRGALAPVPTLPPLERVDYRKALSTVELDLSVVLGKAGVGFGSLLALGIGDVIKLDRTADQPVCVDGPDGMPLLNGFLGLVDGQMALELTSINKQGKV